MIVLFILSILSIVTYLMYFIFYEAGLKKLEEDERKLLTTGKKPN